MKCIKDNFLISRLGKVKTKIKNVDFEAYMPIKTDSIPGLDLRMALVSKSKKLVSLKIAKNSDMNGPRQSTGS